MLYKVSKTYKFNKNAVLVSVPFTNVWGGGGGGAFILGNFVAEF